ncbi:MAG: hypothetical protein ACK559_25595, partial [bacterium]
PSSKRRSAARSIKGPERKKTTAGGGWVSFGPTFFIRSADNRGDALSVCVHRRHAALVFQM